MANAKRVTDSVGLPMVVAGDANLQQPHFNLSRSRSCDAPTIIPSLNLLMTSCRLTHCNPRDRAAHIAGAGSDSIFIYSSHAMEVGVRDGCWDRSISCASPVSCLIRCVQTQRVGPTLPPLRDWKPTLIRAYVVLLQWSVRIQDLSVNRPEMIAILHRHARVQRRNRRRKEPSWWSSECFPAHIA